MNNDNYGYVYCITNKYMPNICKIGFVNKPNKTSHNRAIELSSHTNCPIKFEVEYDIKVKNPQIYEKIIHKNLKKYRINNKREFFECVPHDIIKYFDRNELLKYTNNNNDFANNYMTIYKKEKYKEIKVNNAIYKKIYTCKTFTKDIYYLFIILFNIFISICYYMYIIIKYMMKRLYK